MDVEVRIDQKLKKRWDAALGAVRASRREGSSAFDELWETVAEIVESEPPLYLAGGYATARAFLAEVVGESERSAKRWMRVAKYASPVEETRYGTSKLDAAIGLVEAKNGGPAKRRIPIDFAKLKVPVDSDGKRRLVKLEEATVEQIRAAIRALDRGSKPRRNESPLVAAVRKVLAGKALRGVRVSITKNELTLSGIPIAQVPALTKALAKVDLAAATPRSNA